MAGRWRRTAAAVALAATALTGCASGAEPDGGSAPTDRPADEVAAVLSLLAPAVDVADEPAEVEGAAFRAGVDGEGLVVEDLVRTDDAGFAEVQWTEGALARLDADTLLRVVELDTEPDAAVVVTELDVGRVWNRLRADEVDVYEVRTDVGVAAVRGTAFWVDCDPTGCTFAVLEGTVEVTTNDGSVLLLEPGDEVRVDADGRPEAVGPTDPDDAWVTVNAPLDEDAGFGPLPPLDQPVAAGDPCGSFVIPDGWVEQLNTGDPVPPGTCSWVNPEGGDPDWVITTQNGEAGAFDNRSRIQASHEEIVAEVAASECASGMVSESVEVDEQIGAGRLYGFSGYVASGPDCDEVRIGDQKSFSVERDGLWLSIAHSGFRSIWAECRSGSDGHEATQACALAEAEDRIERIRALAAVLLG